MKINTILIDMDGVIVDFFTGAMHQLGLTEQISQWPKGEGKIEDYAGLNLYQFWHTLDQDPDFWMNLKPYPWTDGLVTLCKAFSKDNVVFVSLPSDNSISWSQKHHWLQSHVQSVGLRVMLGTERHMMSHPGTILIDDTLANCRRFESYGGKAIHFPAITNDNYAQLTDPIAFVKNALTFYANA